MRGRFILLRANPPAGGPAAGTVLAMGGPSPFGMDEAGLAEGLAALATGVLGWAAAWASRSSGSRSATSGAA